VPSQSRSFASGSLLRAGRRSKSDAQSRERRSAAGTQREVERITFGQCQR
jgi:hypothetical protein